MSSKTLLFALAISTSVLAACSSKANNDQPNDSARDSGAMAAAAPSNVDVAVNAPSPEEDNVYYKTVVFGMLQVEAAKLALTQGSDPKIKALAETVIKDSRKSNTEIKKIAGDKGVRMPEILPFNDGDRVAALEKFKGKDFDQQYLTMLVSEHEKAVKFLTAAVNGADAEASAFALKALPVTEGHLKKAAAIK